MAVGEGVVVAVASVVTVVAAPVFAFVEEFLCERVKNVMKELLASNTTSIPMMIPAKLLLARTGGWLNGSVRDVLSIECSDWADTLCGCTAGRGVCDEGMAGVVSSENCTR